MPNNKALDETIDLIIQQDNRKVELLIETSTLSLECKIKNKERLNAINVDILDCPISGTGRQAENKDIVMYASGLKESYEMALPVLETFSRESFFLGDFGNATKVKLIATDGVFSMDGIIANLKGICEGPRCQEIGVRMLHRFL